MNKLNFKFINKFKFIEFKFDKCRMYFSTAEGGLNFNKDLPEGMKNIDNLKKWFKVNKIGYLNQIHSDVVHVYDNNVIEGDAIITNKNNVLIGVFTADCVPILIYDKKKGVIAAVHSGWKGTFKNIIGKTIEKLIKLYNTDVKDLLVYIGPHNMECCYEVSEDLIKKFREKFFYKNTNINFNRNLSLQGCIIKQLLAKGLEENQINKLQICTYCNTDYKLYSYRKQKENNGRMFSFIYLKE